MQPTLKQLKYACSLASHLHFGRAASACYVTQSTLSVGIQDFEQAIGKPIFERTNKQVLITADGIEVIDKAKQILQEVDRLIDMASVQSTPLSGKIILGAIPTISPFLLPSILPVLRNSFPDLKLFLRESTSATLLSDLKNGKIDVALLALPYPSGDLKVLPLFDDQFFLACHISHPLAKRKSLKISDMENQELLLLEEGHCIRDHALSACRLKSGHYGVPFEGTSLQTIIQMVANNIGVTLIPAMSLNNHSLNTKDIKIIPFKNKGVSRSVGLIWRPTSHKQKDIQILGEAIRKHST